MIKLEGMAQRFSRIFSKMYSADVRLKKSCTTTNQVPSSYWSVKILRGLDSVSV